MVEATGISAASLRKKLRRQRRAQPLAYRRQAADAAARTLAALPEFRRARRIAVYWTHGPELDTTPLIRRAHKQGKIVYFPVLGPPPTHRLHFAAWQRGEKLIRNRFGIPEPLQRKTIRPRFLDLMVVPLVGFDRAGNRLGMGGGYYDRTLAYLPRRRLWRRPRLVALAFECQQVEALPSQPWDIAVDTIVTESGVIRSAGTTTTMESTCSTG